MEIILGSDAKCSREMASETNEFPLKFKWFAVSFSCFTFPSDSFSEPHFCHSTVQ